MPTLETPELIYAPQQAERTAQPSSGYSPLLIVAACVLVPGLLGYSFLVADETQAIAGVVALLGLLAIVARPFWGLIFFVALLYTRPEESIPALAGMRLTLCVSLATLVAAWFQMFLDREKPARTPVTGLFLGFAFWAVISTLGHGNTSEAFIEILKLVALVLLILNLVRTPERYRTFVTALIVFTSYLAAYSIYLYFSGQAMWRVGEEILQSKATGIFSDPNDLSATIAAGLALAATRAIQARNAPRYFYGLLTLVMVWAILLTSSRGGMLALLVVIGGAVIIPSKKKLLATGLALLAALSLIGAASGRMTNFDSDEESANSRFHFWDEGIYQLITHPVTGVGFGSFPDVNNDMTAHNSFVLCFAELGVPGYFCWMGCIFYAFRRRPDAGSKRDDAGCNYDLLGARLALGSFLTAIFWISRTYVPVTYIFICLPVVYQLVSNGNTESPTASSLDPPQQAGLRQDFGRILSVCAASVLVIWVMVLWGK